MCFHRSKWGRCWGGPNYALVPCLGILRDGQTTSSPLAPQGWALQHCWASSPLQQWARYRASCFHTIRVDYPTPGPSGQTLLYCSEKVQGMLSQVLQLVMGKNSSPASMDSRASLSPTTGGEGQGVVSFPCPHHEMADEGSWLWESSPVPYQKGQLSWASQVKTRAHFPKSCS